MSTNNESGPLKACLFNLIVYCHDKKRIPYFNNLVRTVIEKFPCHIIFIQKNAELKGDLRITKSIETARKGELALYCDQITIEAPLQEMYRIPFIILPQLIPDLPIYFVWSENPAEELDIYPHLQLIASRVAFESDSASHLSLFCKSMVQEINRAGFDLIDMNWARCTGWRYILAEITDSKERLKKVSECQEIRITYNSASSGDFEHLMTQAIYLQAWLASALGWKFLKKECSNSQAKVIYKNKNNNKEITIFLEPKELDSISSGGILGMCIQSQDQFLIEINRKCHSSQVVLKISDMETCEIPTTLALSNVQTGITFVKELLYAKSCNHYKLMLDAIAQQEWV